MDIVVVGAGYVGLTLAVSLAKLDHNIICVENDIIKFKKIIEGNSTIHEDDIETLIKEGLQKGKLIFTNDYKKAYNNAKIIFVCVQTPQLSNGTADLRIIKKVITQIAKNINNNCLIIVKSTVPVGTCEKLEEYINQNKKSNISINVAFNPEFLSQGTAIYNFFNPYRIILRC